MRYAMILLALSATAQGATPVGDTNWGVAVTDEATGAAYIMYSEQSVHERFENKPHASNADHLICVRDVGETWEYNDNYNWYPFVRVPTDTLVAEVDLTADTVTPLVTGLSFTPNYWNAGPNPGEFFVQGTEFELPLEQRVANLEIRYQEMLEWFTVIARDDTLTTDEDTPITFTREQLLGNDSYLTDVTITITQPEFGTITENPDGSYTYDPRGKPQ